MKQSINDITSGFIGRNPRKEKAVAPMTASDTKATKKPESKKEKTGIMSIDQFEQQKEMMKRTMHVSVLLSPLVMDMAKEKMQKDGIKSMNEVINRALLKYCEAK